jgi:hypothetical protein
METMKFLAIEVVSPPLRKVRKRNLLLKGCGSSTYQEV